MPTPRERLRELGLELPAPPPALASYVPTRLVPLGGGRSLLYVAGQVPLQGGEFRTGRVPDQVSIEKAQEAARLCALNVLAQVEAAAGLDRVEQIAQVIGWVNSTAEFGDQPQVINAASDLIAQVLGEAGRHTRAAVGTNSLPRGVTVEIAAVVVVRTG
ncbi:MAG TPA: RidA family protein [Candidatus Acidoferrales bacterium]|nr:RidA family protein [Candidatus Acidoferrales bacterium]